MPESKPPLNISQIHYVEAATSVLVGTAGAAKRPEGVRAVGLRVLDDGERVAVLIPTALAARTLANLAEENRIAITTAKFPTYSTIQVKGTVTATRQGDEDDYRLVAKFQPRFLTEFVWAGEALANGANISGMPCTVLEMTIEKVFTESPAPLAFAKGGKP